MITRLLTVVLLVGFVGLHGRADSRGAQAPAAGSIASAASQRPAVGPNLTLAAEACAAVKIGTSMPATAIGEPVAAVTLAEPVWQAASENTPAYCRVDGVMAPMSVGPTARAINFRVVLPASWNHRAAQLGGGGMNGSIPNLVGVDGTSGAALVTRGFVTFGSDSGHQAGGPRRGGAAPAPPRLRWRRMRRSTRRRTGR